jgi:hypothetical protein
MTSVLCEYKDIFGKPREGVHAARIPIVDLALWDVVGTILLIYAITYATGKNWISVTIVVCLSFIFLHRLFCVETSI